MTKKVDNIEKKSETNLHNLLMLGPAIIGITKGPNHVFDLANEMYIKVVGNRDIIGKPVREALPELEGHGFVNFWMRFIKQGNLLLPMKCSQQ